MEKISLLLLIAKKSLIGSVIAGVLGFGGITSIFHPNNEANENTAKIEKKIGEVPSRSDPARRR